MKTILLVEDDRDLNEGLTYDLQAEGYNVLSVFNAAEAIEACEQNRLDLVLLDGNLPDGDGFDVCRKIKNNAAIPVLFLTARALDQDELRGFDCGADDYITKPFNIAILHRRIAAALRQYGRVSSKEIYDDGFLSINFNQMTILKNNQSVNLTPTEFKLLRILIENRHQVVTKQLLLDKVWDQDGNYVDDHAVPVNVNRLRKKIEDKEHVYIHTLYGMGYQFRGEG